MITHSDDFFAKGCGRCKRFDTPDCAALMWRDGLAALRAICLDADLTETVKWGHPCYTFADRNIAILGAFRDDFRFSFMNAGLLKDPQGILEKQGPNSHIPYMLKFTAVNQVAARANVIADYLAEAKGYAAAGIKPAKRAHGDLILPDEMIDAMDADPALASAFDALTPGRKRGWGLHFNGAKQSTTRQNRIAKARDKILAGKGWNER